MIEIPIYQVDAFTDHLFRGNPAAICPMTIDLPNTVLQSIAAENNLAETAFFWENKDGFHIRWFTPTIEVNLCGHATLASAFVLFNLLGYTEEKIVFDSRSGPLTVSRQDQKLFLDFPTDLLVATEVPSLIHDALKISIKSCFRGKDDYLIEISSEKELQALIPDFRLLSKLNSRGLIVTAKGDDVDFVSRCFFPQSGIDEDPVTGSAHTSLIPYWSNILNKKDLIAKQISTRGGILYCRDQGERVLIGGQAVLFLKGTIMV